MMHPHLRSPLPVAVPDIGFAQSISIGPKEPDSYGFADLPGDHCSGATRPLRPDRLAAIATAMVRASLVRWLAARA
jgi:hypothetical protein